MSTPQSSSPIQNTAPAALIGVPSAPFVEERRAFVRVLRAAGIDDQTVIEYLCVFQRLDPVLAETNQEAK